MDLNLPAKLNLFEVATMQPYYVEYNKTYQEFQKNVKTKKTTKQTTNLIFWAALVAFLVYLSFSGHTSLVWVAGIIGAIICGIISSSNSPGKVSSDFEITRENEEICKKIINEIIRTNFPESRYIYSWGKALIYNNNVFAYISVAEGLLVIYKSNDLKNIRYTSVNGTHDYGANYKFVPADSSNQRTGEIKGNIVWTGEKGYKNELLIEISTGYMAYPIIKFNVLDTPQFREAIDIAISILC